MVMKATSVSSSSKEESKEEKPQKKDKGSKPKVHKRERVNGKWHWYWE